MKKLALALLLASAGVALASGDVVEVIHTLNGSPSLLGIITVTDGGPVNNWTTQIRDAGMTVDPGDGGSVGVGAPFDAGFGAMIWMQCDGGVHVASGSDSTTVATGYSWKILGDEKFYTFLKPTQNTVSIKPCCGNAAASCALYKAE